MARRLRNAAALAHLGKLVPRKIRECRDRLSTRLVRHQPQRQLVAPAVAQDWVVLRGVHRPCTLLYYVDSVNSEYLQKVASYSVFSRACRGVDY